MSPSVRDRLRSPSLLAHLLLPVGRDRVEVGQGERPTAPALGLGRVERFAPAWVLGVRVLASLGRNLDQVVSQGDELPVLLGVLPFSLLHLNRKRREDPLDPAILAQQT
jgi:hypothetical protein